MEISWNFVSPKKWEHWYTLSRKYSDTAMLLKLF